MCAFAHNLMTGCVYVHHRVCVFVCFIMLCMIIFINVFCLFVCLFTVDLYVGICTLHIFL